MFSPALRGLRSASLALFPLALFPACAVSCSFACFRLGFGCLCDRERPGGAGDGRRELGQRRVDDVQGSVWAVKGPALAAYSDYQLPYSDYPQPYSDYLYPHCACGSAWAIEGPQLVDAAVPLHQALHEGVQCNHQGAALRTVAPPAARRAVYSPQSLEAAAMQEERFFDLYKLFKRHLEAYVASPGADVGESRRRCSRALAPMSSGPGADVAGFASGTLRSSARRLRR